MTPAIADRDQLFKTFGRAWFRRDVDLLYEAVTPDFTWAFSDGNGNAAQHQGREAVGAALRASVAPEGFERRFENVVYHHAPEATFMTFRVVERNKATGALREEIGVERYTFRDGRIALKDVYRKNA